MVYLVNNCACQIDVRTCKVVTSDKINVSQRDLLVHAIGRITFKIVSLSVIVGGEKQRGIGDR